MVFIECLKVGRKPRYHPKVCLERCDTFRDNLHHEESSHLVMNLQSHNALQFTLKLILIILGTNCNYR